MNVAKIARRSAAALAISMVAAPLLASASYAAGLPPAQPTITSLTSANRQATATWTETSTGRITFTATAKSTGHPTRSCRTRAKSCKVVSLINGVTYEVTVVGQNASGKSPASAPMSVTIGAPSAPLSVHATAVKGGTANVRWAPPSSSGISAITGYTASASSKTDGPFTCASKGAARSCTISGLTKGNVYAITVTATNKYGTSPASKPFSLTAK
ncbi:MAG TPA: fibronectin type III domain-containing protein [Acidimicrobiales bacterium]|jgi:titin|nr:fibronectin type III domain-containing protein [Acidimicrobiales bacterium]